MSSKHNDSTFYDVVGIGNAIVDVMAKIGDRFLTERSLPKGGMVLLDALSAGKIYQDIVPQREVSGGSAANTVAGMASLGLACAFIGKVHDDALGQAFSRDIGATGIDFFTPPLTQGPSTGRSIVLVTPDAERSMFTYLGASTHLSVEDIDEKTIQSARMTYVEGYLWEEEAAKAAILKAAELAHKHNRDFVFSLSDKSCVERHRSEFLDLIQNRVDILFGNEEELNSLFESDDFEHNLDLIKPMVDIAAITRNIKGSVVVSGRVKTFVESETVENVVDTTGAGDLYAAGFLYGLLNNRSIGTCAMIGGLAAAEIISHYGARPETSLRGYVRNNLVKYGKTL